MARDPRDRPPGLSRRAALTGAAATAAMACTPKGSASDGVRPAEGDDTGAGATAGRIDHVIMVMMENRSFDHWYGARRLVEGLSEEDGIPDGLSLPGGDGSSVTPSRATELCPADPPHGYSSTGRQVNGGAMDGFCLEMAARHGGSGADAAAYLTRDDLPVSWALADAYRTCDRYFCSVPGPTWPNRLYGHMASSQGQTGNDLPEGGTFTERTIWRALEEAGLEWRYYYTDLPFIGLFEGHHSVERVKLVEDFFKDCEHGRLPPVSWVDPGFSYNDNHPPHHPGLGELFIASIHEALATSPLWDRVLVVLTYDEHGGFFDHVTPPACADDRADEGFGQLGVRVPTVLWGPWVQPGVDHTVYDHTSWLRYVCERFGIEPWNARLSAATSLSGALDAERMARGEPRPPAELPAFDFDESQLSPDCSYFDLRPDHHLKKVERVARARGIPVRLGERERLARLFQAVGRRRGLLG